MNKTEKELAFLQDLYISTDWTERFTDLLGKDFKADEFENILYINAGSGNHALALEEKLDDLPLEIGKFVVAKRGAGQDLLSLRDYQPNDDFRAVDWKATARSNRLIVREYAAEDEKRITIFLDSRVNKSAEEKQKTLRARIEEEQKGGQLSASSKRFEDAIEKTASLLSHFTDERAEIRLTTDDERGNFQTGTPHLYDNLKRLATIEPKFSEDITFDELSENIQRLLDDENNSHIFLITTLRENDFPPEIGQRIKIVGF